MVNRIKPEIDNNVYLKMPIERVRQDAKQGVSLARQAWRIRQPVEAAKALGHIIEPEEAKEIILSR